MSAFVLRGKSNSHIFTIDRGIVARENASDNVNILDQDYAQNLGILLDRSEVAGALNVIRYAVYPLQIQEAAGSPDAWANQEHARSGKCQQAA